MQFDRRTGLVDVRCNLPSVSKHVSTFVYVFVPNSTFRTLVLLTILRIYDFRILSAAVYFVSLEKCLCRKGQLNSARVGACP